MALETKLHPPALRKEWLDRTELLPYLSKTAAKLILVDAPAGFGKTVLVGQWCASLARSRPCAWVSLDRGDNDPVRLWGHVISALRRACPELASGGALWPPPAGPPDLTGKVLPALVNKLAALPTPVVLVLDDYHLITERVCHQQIGFLLRHLPSAAQLVFITRADPPLPLARLRASGEMTEIRARELRFTPADTAALVSTIAAVNLSAADASDLAERTEGWPAGIYLVALSLRNSPSPGAFIRQFTGNHRLVADFLAEEVMSRQPPEVRRFLRRASILDRFTASLCDAVAETSTAAEVIARLERDNLFLVSLDDHRLWYRFHHLFAQMLRGQLAQTEPGIAPALHHRASAWYRERGSVEEAVGHSLSSGDIPGTIDLIAHHWYAFVDTGQAATVRSWFRSLGDDRIRQEPVAAHCAAWVAALSGDRHSMLRWLEVVEAGQHEGPLPDGMRSLQSSAAMLRGAFGFDGIRVMRESAATAVELESDPASPWYALARSAFGFGLYLSGEMGAASAALDQAVLSEAAFPLVRMLALAVASVVAAEEGRLGQAQEFASAARRVAEGRGLSDTPQGRFVHMAVGTVHAQQGKPEEARGAFERALRARRRSPGLGPWPDVEVLLRLAAVLLDIGDRPAAKAPLAEVRHVLISLPDGAEALQARLNRLEWRLAGVSPGTPLEEPLTRREEAVLRLLRGSLSLSGIGRELDLSANTIKTHTRAIYRKLGVGTRSDAIQRARELGILPMSNNRG